MTTASKHYDCAVLPARPRHPRDKPKVEGAVLLVQTWILARLRNRRFFSLGELNVAIKELLADLNQRPFKKLPGCRRSAFELLDAPALRPLPASRYVISRWKTAKVNIVDTTVQEKAIAHPVDSRLLEIARHKVVSAAKRVGISLKQTYAKEGKALRRRAAGYAHAKQFRRLKRVIKRQRTILGVVIREVQRKRAFLDEGLMAPKAWSELSMWLERAERVRTQQTKDKNKLYALHAPEVECIGKGKARKPYEFGVKNSLVVSHEHGLMLGARTFSGNPYDGHILSASLEQATNLTQDLQVQIKEVVVDLGYRGIDEDNPGKLIIHRGKLKSLCPQQKAWLRRRQAIEPAIGHLKSDHRLDRCWLKGEIGDALHAISCAAGYNLRWLLRAVARLGIGPIFLRLLQALLRLTKPPLASYSTYSTR